MRMIDRRLGLLFCGFCLLFSLALVRSFWLQGVEGGQFKAEAHNQQTDTVTVPGLRGRIVDRNGKVLAASEDAVNVIATPYQVTDPAGTAAKIANLTGEPQTDLLEKLSDRESGYAVLARKVDLQVAERIKKQKLAGIYTLPDSRRLYPQGELAAQVIGAVGTDNNGLTGLEQADEDVLGGDDGKEEVVYDGQGDPIRLDNVTPAKAGSDIQLTIDAAIQGKAEEALASAGEQWGAKGASAVVMDPKSGDILAMANWPGYDPRELDQASPDELANRPTGFTYEPGSTFKAFTVAAALEEGLVTPDTSFHLPSTIQVADRVIEESHARPPIDATVAQILAQSSNVGAVTIGLEVGADSFSQWIDKFGFGEPTGVQYPAEERGIVPDRSDYSGSTMGNLPIGQGLAVTPLQMAAGYSAIANGGILRQPRLIVQKGDESIDPDTEGRRVMSTHTSAQLRTMLEGVLEPGGTASSVSVPGYVLAGKTGTAEKAEDGGYSESKYVASFVGFAPAQNPKLLVAVVVDEPTYEHTGGAVAAPVFGDIAEFALPYLGISPG
jgi:cell division protein FtsI (penicillin-binding protein 3)